MKLKKFDYTISEELFTTSCMLKMLCNEYDEKIPKDVMESLEHTILLADKHLAKDFEPIADINEMELVSRVTFDMDSIKEIERTRKRQEKE